MPACQKCGSQLPEGNKFCPRCGTQVQEASTPTEPPGAAQSPGPPPGTPLPPVASGTPRRKKGISRGAKVAIGLGIGAVLLIILTVVLFVVFFMNVIGAPADVANNYVRALSKGDISTAWGYLAEETRKEETRAGFETKVKALAGEIEKWYTTSVDVNTGNAKIVMSVTLKGGSKVTWEMYLIKEGGEWKVRQVSPV